VWRAPCPLDAAGTLLGEPRARFVAACDAEVSFVVRDRASNESIVAALTAENARLWERVERDARRDDDSFLPLATPVPGPWHFRRARAMVLVVQGDPRRQSAALPRGVHLLPGTGGRYVLAATRFEDAGSLDARDGSRFVYHEVAPFLPVWSGRRGPAAFIPELYPDAWMAVLLGREIHGFPKRTARIGFHEDGAELLVDRRLAMRLRFRARSPIPADEAFGALVRLVAGGGAAGGALARLVEWPPVRRVGLSVLVHKRIGACETAGRTLAIDDVVRVPLAVDPVAGAWHLQGLTLELPGGSGLLHGEVVGGYFIESGFRFGRGFVERRRASK